MWCKFDRLYNRYCLSLAQLEARAHIYSLHEQSSMEPMLLLLLLLLLRCAGDTLYIYSSYIYARNNLECKSAGRRMHRPMRDYYAFL